MCNACGFWCCAYDGFEGCGCEHCPEPECWGDDDEADDGFGLDADWYDRQEERERDEQRKSAATEPSPEADDG
jgi:hypothetical protein